MSNVTENPNDKMPAGKPLDRETIVEEGDGGARDDAPDAGTATSTIDREKALRPNGSVSPDEPNPTNDPTGIENSNTLTSP